MTEEKKEEKFSGVRAKLAAHKKEASGEDKNYSLPISKISISIPGFINHGAWNNAQRLGKGDVAGAQLAFAAEVVKFEGEKLTATDMRELCDAKDIMFITAKIFGEDDEAEEAGND